MLGAERVEVAAVEREDRNPKSLGESHQRGVRQAEALIGELREYLASSDEIGSDQRFSSERAREDLIDERALRDGAQPAEHEEVGLREDKVGCEQGASVAFDGGLCRFVLGLALVEQG